MSTKDEKSKLDLQRDYVKQDHIKKMQEYVDQKRGGSGGLFDAELAVASMRSVVYRSEAHAAGDILDNSIEAGASQVHVVINENKGKITDIAFVDDGSGIWPGFLPWATSWGGSSHHGDTGKRNTFGRFGFGLPTASINRGTAYDVISRYFDPDTGVVSDFSMVTIDLRNLPRGDDGLPTSPPVTTGVLPVFVVNYLAAENSPFVGGIDAVRTVIVWRNLDRLTAKSVQALESLMLNHFGITYASWLDTKTLWVNGKKVEPIDLLFTSRDALYYDVKGTFAEDHGVITVPIKDSHGTPHDVTVRLSRMTTEAWDALTPQAPGVKGRNWGARLRLKRDYNGVIMTRHGRFIQVWNPSVRGVQWNNYMRQVGIHLDFPPELDELFGITPDKQTITPGIEVVDALENKGVWRAVRDLAKAVFDERAKQKAEADAVVDETTRISEEVMDRVVDIIDRPIISDEESHKKKNDARKNLERKVKEKSAITGVPEDIVRDQLVEETTKKRFQVEFVSLGENGVFYNPEQRGTQTVLQINTQHAFFKEIYSKTQFEARSGLELLLFTFAVSELDAIGERRAWYLNERIRWSQYLTTQVLVQSDVIASTPLRAFAGETAPGPHDAEFDD